MFGLMEYNVKINPSINLNFDRASIRSTIRTMNVNVEQNIGLAQFTTYHVGGKARFFARIQTWQQMFALREFAKQQRVPYVVLGGGSNIIFADEGYPGLVIMNQMNKVKFHGEFMTAEGGAILSKAVMIAAQQNLGGVSGLANVPGTVGGAVYGNAGVSDICIGNIVAHAEILPANSKEPMIVGPDYCNFGYRTSAFKTTNDVILSATLKLRPTPFPVVQSEIKEYIKQRMLKQPIGMSCGSFFKNPSEFPSAGWLIDQAGCKGMKVVVRK